MPVNLTNFTLYVDRPFLQRRPLAGELGFADCSRFFHFLIMCFSANASFGAGIVLSALGVASLRKAKKPEQKLFAAIPLVFAAQQVTEGVLWLTYMHPELGFLQQGAVRIFLFFAQIVWPVWVPYAIGRMETNRKRKPFLQATLAAGVLVALGMVYCFIQYPVSAYVDGSHIVYVQNFSPWILRIGAVLYMISTVSPAFLSSMPRMWMVGSAILVSYVLTVLIYHDAVVSVWCFFASVISLFVYFLIPGPEKRHFRK